MELWWEDPGFLRFSKRLGRFSRTVWFQGRGLGASEGDVDEFRREVHEADLVAVLDAVGAERPALAGLSSLVVIPFSVSHPERVSSLVLVEASAHGVREDDYPWGFPRESLDELAALATEGWGTGSLLRVLAPSRSSDERLQSAVARSERLGLGPDQFAKSVKLVLEVDLRQFLPLVTVPTLVLHHQGNRFVELGAGRYVAEHIPGAKFVVLPGDDHVFFMGDADALVDEIEEFLTGARSGAEADVVTATVLFTDIVGSTDHQARVGQRQWSRLTDHHDAIVRAALTRHRGREIKTTGDGFLATFDATGRALRCAAETLAAARGIGLELRAGVHTGEVEIRGDDIAGLAVTIAKRVCDLAAPAQVLFSETVRSLMVGSGIEFEDRGEHELKGVPGTWRLFALKDR
jgi:class 3 adenylate cyclase/pimeloyl-ACP methyl ester carboxylesterase